MKWYPWLNSLYKKIIFSYIKTKFLHSLIIYSNGDNGQNSLCYAISRWLICNNPIGIKSCNICCNCNMMINNFHPDFFQIISKNKQYIGIDNIRILIEKINFFSINNRKVIFIKNIEFLTEQAINCLLKIIEEPPKNTYFLLSSKNIFKILLTLKSRCILFNISPPNIKYINNWLIKKKYNPLNIKIAINMSNGSLILTEKILNYINWNNRKYFFNILNKSIDKKNILFLFPILNKLKNINILYYFILIISDVIKFKLGIKENLINIDFIYLIEKLNLIWSLKDLNSYWKQWINFIYIFKNVQGINYKLLVLNYLLKMNKF